MVAHICKVKLVCSFPATGILNCSMFLFDEGVCFALQRWVTLHFELTLQERQAQIDKSTTEDSEVSGGSGGAYGSSNRLVVNVGVLIYQIISAKSMKETLTI